ncbi:hypothetical protein HW115_01440 [Verrucomicrobiaceae bacterium N1E253]|uniref:Uncharacterized protein n=1 Tax=Oceaniferula marina TaxID=2748318 RepID=A0A851G965_9BACT|nr:hypothetical protein [Oceaniferula marina]NWK54258.1 hypothetical protein [Oceaniferula marina]
MKSKRRVFVIKTALVIVIVLVAVVGGLSLPGKVEGVYSAGKLIQCACDGTDYIRFHGGWVAHYSTNHEPANLIGRYEIRPDESVVVYITPFRKGDPEEIVFTIDQPRIGFSFATIMEEDKSYLLMRVPVSDDIEDMISHQDVMQVSMSDEDTLVTTFYNSEHVEIREEVKSLKNKKAEQDVAPDG